MLQRCQSVCLSVKYVLWLNGASQIKVTIDSLQKVVYEESIGTQMNDLDLRLEIVQDHVNHCVTFAIEYLGNS